MSVVFGVTVVGVLRLLGVVVGVRVEPWGRLPRGVDFVGVFFMMAGAGDGVAAAFPFGCVMRIVFLPLLVGSAEICRT